MPSASSNNENEVICEPNSMDLNEFAAYAKKLEAKRMKNAPEEDRMIVSGEPFVDVEGSYNPEMEEEEWRIDRYLRLQAEEEMRNVGPAGRLTAPPNEARTRKRKPNKMNTDQTDFVDELRAKQLKLVDEQIYLQNILQQNALNVQEEIRDRHALVKANLAIAELDICLKKKQLEQS